MFGGRQAELVERPVEQPVRVEDQPPRVDACEVRRPERKQHEDEQHRSGAAPARRAMKYANGNAMIASVIVTAAAIEIVRSATVW